MASIQVNEYLKVVPAVLQSPEKYLWSTYDQEADVLYINFKKPSRADDSELTDDDIIIRYEKGKVIGLTVLHAKQRITKRAPCGRGIPPSRMASGRLCKRKAKATFRASGKKRTKK